MPTDGDGYGGYDDGRYMDYASLKAMFPTRPVVSITVFPNDDFGDCLDVETGDATPAQAPGWVHGRRSTGVDPTVYCNSSTWPSVRSAFATAKEVAPHYWIAQGDGVASIPAEWLALGCVAKQYGQTAGGGADISAVVDYWPGIDPQPNPTAAAVLSVAASQVGHVAGPGNTTPYSQWYQDTYPLPGNNYQGENWCAMFTSWCWEHANPPMILHFAYCPTGVNAFRAFNMWGSMAKVGDAVFYDWNRDGVADHVGLVESVDAAGVHTIEGNAGTPPGVYRHLIGPEGDRGTGDVLGYGHPPYAPSAVVPPTPQPEPVPPLSYTVEIDNVNLTKTLVNIGPLGPNGAGWDVFDGRDPAHPAIPFASAFGCYANGSDPTTGGYVEVPSPTFNDRGGNVQVEAFGPAGYIIGVWIVHAE